MEDSSKERSSLRPTEQGVLQWRRMYSVVVRGKDRALDVLIEIRDNASRQVV